MCPLVYFEVFRSREHFAATRKRAGEWFLSRVHSDMVHQLVLRFKRPPVPRAALPEACVRCAFRPSDVFYCEVRYDLVHTGEQFVAHFARRRLLGVEPLAAHVTSRRGAHVPQEGMRGVRVCVRHERWRPALVVDVTAPLPALLERLLRKQLAAGAVLAQVAGLVGVQRVGLVVRRVVRWRMRRGGAMLWPHAATRLGRHLQPVRGEMRMVGFEEGVHGGGGRRRRIAPFARHHPRGGGCPLMIFLTRRCRRSEGPQALD